MNELISLAGVCKAYPMGGRNKTHALCDVSLQIGRGETVGLVGESGSGKSTLARIVMGIEQPDSGEVRYAGKPVVVGRGGGQSQIIFQDTLGALDPRMTVGASIAEGMEIHRMLDSAGRRERVGQLLELVGLERGHAARYPQDFSGGQRQRICIARALAVNPKFLVCDEVISALDISVQSHIMNLLRELKERLGLTYLFIAHDLNRVNYLSDRIAVLYLGRVVELGESDGVCQKPQHPYTRLLLDAVLLPDPKKKTLARIPIRVGDALPVAMGCAFAGGCPQTQAQCHQAPPVLREWEPGHFVACHLAL